MHYIDEKASCLCFCLRRNNCIYIQDTALSPFGAFGDVEIQWLVADGVRTLVRGYTVK